MFCTVYPSATDAAMRKVASRSYNLRAEWGPSSFGDVRQRAVIGASLPMP